MSTENDTLPRVGCTVDVDGRITFDLPPGPAEGQQLLLRLRPKKGRPERDRPKESVHVVDLEPGDDGRRRAVLGPRPLLAEGRWDVFLREEPGAEEQPLRPGPRDLRALVDGRLRDRQSPLAVRIPYVTRDGHLAVRTWLRPAHAEVGDIGITDRSMTVGARLHGAPILDGAVVQLRLRGGSGTVHTVEPLAEDDGRSFSFTVDCAELTAGTGAGSGIWNVSVRPAAGAPPVRFARLLDDVADRRDVFVYPAVTVGAAVVRPFYTADNNFSVTVTKDR